MCWPTPYASSLFSYHILMNIDFIYFRRLSSFTKKMRSMGWMAFIIIISSVIDKQVLIAQCLTSHRRSTQTLIPSVTWSGRRITALPGPLSAAKVPCISCTAISVLTTFPDQLGSTAASSALDSTPGWPWPSPPPPPRHVADVRLNIWHPDSHPSTIYSFLILALQENPPIDRSMRKLVVEVVLRRNWQFSIVLTDGCEPDMHRLPIGDSILESLILFLWRAVISKEWRNTSLKQPNKVLAICICITLLSVDTPIIIVCSFRLV